MINPVMAEMLNRERLKDLDREAEGLRYSRLARQSRQQFFRTAVGWVGDLMIALGNRLKAKTVEGAAACRERRSCCGISS